MEPGTEGVAVHTAEKEGHQDLIVGYTAFADNHRTDLLVPAAAVRAVLAVHIDLDRVGLAGHILVLVPAAAVHTAAAVGQVGEDQKVGRNRLVQVVHLGVGRTGRIEVGHRGHQEPDRAVVAVRTAQIAVDRRNRLAAAEAVVAVAVAVEVLLRKVIRLHPMLVLLLISMRDPLYLLIDDRKVLVCVMEGG